MRNGNYHMNVCMLHLSPPGMISHLLLTKLLLDENGFCTMGAGVETTRAAAECADVIIAEINSRMPRCYGDTLVHMSHLDKVVYVDRDLPHYELPGKTITCN